LATYSIRDLENISGIKAHTLRMWEQRYEILHPKRTGTNIRLYDDEDLRLLLSISRLNCNGYKISAIARMSRAEIHQACQNLHSGCDECSHQINALSLAMLDLDEERFEQVISVSAQRYGFEETMLRIVFPFFKQVGMLWQTGAVSPVQEHFVSNLVRQKLIAAIDAQEAPGGEGAARFALFLPCNELHEMGLLFAAYLLRVRGKRVIYLGQSVPEEDLASVYEMLQPDYFFTILTMAPPKESIQAYLGRLGKRFPKSKIIVTGAAIQNLKAIGDNMVHLLKPQDLIGFVDRSG
jgi:DNA-binding transcriptional MerR regulator